MLLTRRGQRDGVERINPFGLRGGTTEAAGVTSREQRGPRGAAHRMHIVGFEPQALPGQLVQVGHRVLGTVPRHVMPTQIVGHDDQDVGSLGGLSTDGRKQDQQRRQQPGELQQSMTSSKKSPREGGTHLTSRLQRTGRYLAGTERRRLRNDAVWPPTTRPRLALGRAIWACSPPAVASSIRPSSADL